MQILNYFVRIPVSSDQIKSTSLYCAGIATCTLVQDYTSLLGWTFGLASLAGFAIQAVKRQLEKEQKEAHAAQQFCSKLLNCVEECVNSHQNPYTPEARQQMLELFKQVRSGCVYTREGNDDFRAQFVGAQNAMEHVLAAQKVLQIVPTIVGAIHTPVPATPLCTQLNSTQLADLMAPSIRHNKDKLTTVADRALSIRQMLSQTGTLLYAVYAQGGLHLRKPAEQQTFMEALQTYQGKLFASEMSCQQIDPTKVGALYLFTDEANNCYAFSIKAQQANSPQDKSVWGIWFGSLSHSAIQNRVKETNDYLVQNRGSDVLQIFSQQCLQGIRAKTNF